MVSSLARMIYLAVMISLYIQTSSGHNGTALQKHLFTDYKPEVRPCADYNKPLLVEIRLSLIKILSVNEITQTFKTTVTIIIDWKDQLLTWDPNLYGAIEHIVVPYGKVWTPDIITINAAETPGEIGQKYALVRVVHDGSMKIWTQVNLKTQCNIATKQYPFDVQECHMTFCTFMSDDRDIDLRPNINKTELKYYEKTAEWNIVGNFVSVTKDIASDEGLGNYTMINYNFKLQRQCLSCIINIILPVVLLGCLSLLAFFVPSDSGEKMSFPVSIFLTLAVFMTVITLSLPESVDGLSYLGMYVTFELGTGVITLACSVIALRLYEREESERKLYYHILLVKIFRPKYQHVRYLNTVSGRRSFKRNSEKFKAPESEEDSDNVNTRCRNNSSNTDYAHVATRRLPDNTVVLWTHVSRAFDMCVFTLMVIIQVLALISFVCLIRY